MLIRVSALLICLTVLSFGQHTAGTKTPVASPSGGQYEYRVLATNKTSTMQKEMNAAAAEGFHFGAVMGGETAFGGKETVVIMMKEPEAPAKQRYRYMLLATNKTSTMQKELQAAGDEGFDYKGQTVFETAFGGQEVVVILESDREAKSASYEYKLLATSKTGTMQKEISAEGRAGFALLGLTVAKTSFGGAELVAILRRTRN
jgi:hypothetical protein